MIGHDCQQTPTTIWTNCSGAELHVSLRTYYCTLARLFLHGAQQFSPRVHSIKPHALFFFLSSSRFAARTFLPLISTCGYTPSQRSAMTAAGSCRKLGGGFLPAQCCWLAGARFEKPRRRDDGCLAAFLCTLAAFLGSCARPRGMAVQWLSSRKPRGEKPASGNALFQTRFFFCAPMAC